MPVIGQRINTNSGLNFPESLNFRYLHPGMNKHAQFTTARKQWVLHVFVWASVYFFWYQYYAVVDPPEVIAINAGICTVFACLTFCCTYLYIAPFITKQGNLVRFILSAGAMILLLSFLRSMLIYANFEITLPGNFYWEPFRSFTTSAFHIMYAITVATVLRLFTEQYQILQHMANLEKEKVNAELLYLRNQVNPHFLFNVHNNVNFLISENPELASRVILKLSEVMRYQLYDCQQDWVPIDQELANIENYIELEKIRSEGRIEISYHKTIYSGAKLISPFILITFVENSFKHVAREPASVGSIYIVAHQSNDSFLFSVANDADFQQSPPATGSGIGLDNLKKRLYLIYGNTFHLVIKNQDRRFEVELKLPLK